MKATRYEDAMRLPFLAGVRVCDATRGTILASGLLVLLLCGGCHHKQAPPTLPAILKAPDAPPPAPDAPHMEGAPPDSVSTAPLVKVTETQPKRRSRKSVPKTAPEAPASAEAASAIPPPTAPASPLGQLSTGGESNSLNQREANDLILSSERRLEALLKTKTPEQETHTRDQSREIRRFLEQARQALATGDAEGAKTLATKAKLLLDDFEKWVQQE